MEQSHQLFQLHLALRDLAQFEISWWAFERPHYYFLEKQLHVLSTWIPMTPHSLFEINVWKHSRVQVRRCNPWAFSCIGLHQAENPTNSQNPSLGKYCIKEADTKLYLESIYDTKLDNHVKNWLNVMTTWNWTKLRTFEHLNIQFVNTHVRQ